jgi:hypothetical protein
MYSITENIYYSQLSSVAILLQPETNCFTSYNTRKALCSLSLSVLSSCGLPLPPTCLLLTANEARSYFASTILVEARAFCGTTTFISCSQKPATGLHADREQSNPLNKINVFNCSVYTRLLCTSYHMISITLHVSAEISHHQVFLNRGFFSHMLKKLKLSHYTP